MGPALKFGRTASNTWMKLQFRSAALDGPRKLCEEAQARSKGLAEAIRARHFHAELPEQKKFNLGASTVRFVLQEQTNVAQAQTDELKQS